MEEMKNALEIENLCVDLGTFKINGLNLNVKSGMITGLIGANGAGKSTLIKTVMRAVRAQSGSILYDGKRFAGNEREILRNIACVFDDVIFNPYDKPAKIAKLYSGLYPNFDMDKYEKLVARFSLPQKLRVNKYSFGMKKKLIMCLALCQGARLLILDEPTSGVDPYDRSALIELIQEFMTDENNAVLFSTHITEDLDKIADYIVMMDNGRIIIDESKDALIADYRIVRTREMTSSMQASAIGVVKDMFGYTFVTRDLSVTEGDGVQVNRASVQDIFVHVLGQQKRENVYNSSTDIFGI